MSYVTVDHDLDDALWCSTDEIERLVKLCQLEAVRDHAQGRRETAWRQQGDGFGVAENMRRYKTNKYTGCSELL